jgi:hypothetical protein
MAEDDVDDIPLEDDGPQGEGTEGQDTGEGDEDGEVPAEQSDASSGEDDGPRKAAGDEEDRPLTRGGNRFQRLSNDNAGLREELAALRQQREEEARRSQQQQQQWDEQAWNDRWAVMTPEEKVQYAWERGRQELTQYQRQTNYQLALMKDQMSYEAKATVNPVYQRYAKEVEKVFNERLQQGRGMWREDILKNLLGEKAISSAGKSTMRAARVGNRKIEAQTTRPLNSRGDAASTRGRQGDTAERRLAGIEI